MVKPRPLERLFSSPRQLLDKARRDLDRLIAASRAGDETACRAAMMDACVSVYHVKDWIAAMHPGHKVAATKLALESPFIMMCREICHASKHVSLDLDGPAYRTTPMAFEKLDQSITNVSLLNTSPIGTHVLNAPFLRTLKVSGRRYGEHHMVNVIGNAIGWWESFLAEKKIPRGGVRA